MTWKQLPAKVKALIVLFSVLSLPITIWAIWDIFFFYHDSNWIILLILTIAIVPAFFVLPSSTIIGIGDAFIMAVAMLYGTSPCIITTLFHTVAATLFVPNRPRVYAYKVVFNTSSMICGAFLYSSVYHLLNPLAPPLSTDLRYMLLPAIALTITFFLFNSIITSTAISWASGENTFQFWIRNCVPLSIDFSVSAVSAVVIVALRNLSEWAPFGAAPLVALIWAWNKTNRAKAMDAERHLKERAMDAEHHLKEQEALYLRTVETLALAVDAKDQTTYGHIRRVKAYALGLARLSGITDANVLRAIETGSLLHDIGKLAIEDYILNKPGRLSRHEFEKMKLHSTAGDEILRQVQFPFPVAQYVRCHHERWDGKGYPDGLKGTDIPIGARILSISDAFDAIRSSRPYKSSFGLSDSVELLRTQAGNSYDPELVELFIRNIDELEAAALDAAQNMSELSFRKYFENVNNALVRADAALAEASLPGSSAGNLVHLFEFCGGVGRSLGLADSLPILARRIGQIVPYDLCAFFLGQEDGRIRCAYACGDSAVALQGATVALGKGISGWVAAHKRPMRTTDPALEFEGTGTQFADLKDVLSVPMVVDGECLGAITLYAEKPNRFSSADLSLLQTIAEQVATLLGESRERAGPETADPPLDPVTGAHRISYLSVAGTQLLAQAAATDAPLSLVFLEIRNFSQCVALYGSGAGDVILRRVADILRAELRQTDVLVRFGHHGFVAVLPGVRGPQAIRYAQRLQQLIKGTPINLTPGNCLYANCQSAVATYPNDGTSVLALLQNAQRALADQARLLTPPAGTAEGNVLEFPPRI